MCIVSRCTVITGNVSPMFDHLDVAFGKGLRDSVDLVNHFVKFGVGVFRICRRCHRHRNHCAVLYEWTIVTPIRSDRLWIGWRCWHPQPRACWRHIRIACRLKICFVPAIGFRPFENKWSDFFSILRWLVNDLSGRLTVKFCVECGLQGIYCRSISVRCVAKKIFQDKRHCCICARTIVDVLVRTAFINIDTDAWRSHWTIRGHPFHDRLIQG
jgi:hypothetical protein